MNEISRVVGVGVAVICLLLTASSTSAYEHGPVIGCFASIEEMRLAFVKEHPELAPIGEDGQQHELKFDEPISLGHGGYRIVWHGRDRDSDVDFHLFFSQEKRCDRKNRKKHNFVVGYYYPLYCGALGCKPTKKK